MVVISEIVRVPVMGGLLNSTNPERLNVFVVSSQGEGVGIRDTTEHSVTMLQLVVPAPG